MIFCLISCHQPKCLHAIKYQTNTINIKALKSKIGKNSDIDFNVGDISIDPKYREANDKIQELDLLQYSICDQLNRMKDGYEKEKKRKEYVEALIEMIKIAKNPEKSDPINK